MQWLKAFLALATSAVGAERVIINEIHFDSVEKGPLEFVELHNPSERPVTLEKWRLDKYQFPAGSRIEPGGYVVVAQDPAAFQKHFGKPAMGPLPGKLSNSGEKLTLTDAAGRLVESVKYGVGFPWPSASAGGGSSIERIHPSLDSSEPAHWRASGFAAEARDPIVLVPAASTWRWHKGDKQVPAPPWRDVAFVEDAAWQTGKAGLGYGDGDDATTIGDMQGRYGTIFLRHAFAAPASRPAALVLRVQVDDGCIVWLNGKEVARLHVAAGEPTLQTLAVDHEAGDWEEVVIANAAALLQDGKNVLAVQVFNSARDSSDLSFDLSLQTPSGKSAMGKHPTPGAANSVFATIPPPACRSVSHAPTSPKPGEAVKITADFAAAGAPRAVTLQMQIVEPGAYIRKADPDYAQRWENVPMRDDGAAGDARAGDHVWTAILPSERQTNRRLIRYRIAADDASGTRTRLPYTDDEVPNFAYYVWAGSPAWTGAMRPGKTAPVTFSGEFQRSLQTFTLLANADDVARSQWDGGFNHRKVPGTLVYDGRVYDHMEFKNRGSASTYVTGKNKWGFHFTRGQELRMRDAWGRPYESTWNSFALNACASPWVQINRGMAGLDEAISFRCYQLAGVPSSDTVPIHLRVVTSAEEQGKTQYDGDLWGLYLIVEDVDGAFLDNHRWPDGIIASHEKGIKREPSDLGEDPRKPWGEFAGGPHGNPEKWWRQRMDLQSYYSFHAINRLVGNADLRHGANHHFYRHPESGWMPVPWDLDMQFIPRHHQAGIIDQTRCLDLPALKLEYQNRAREILDLLASDPRPNGGQIGQVVAEYARWIEPNGPGKPEQSWAMLDAFMWNHHPRSNTKGAFYQQETSQQMFGGSFTRKLATPDFAGFCRYIVEYCTDTRPQKNYAPNDGNWLGYGWGYVNGDAKDDKIPARPVIRYTGPAGYPNGALTFAISSFSDPQGTQTFAAVQWRLASIGENRSGPWNYEIEPEWLGSESPAQIPETHIPGANCKRGTTYRVRARYKDDTGRWSHWSEAVEWVANGPGTGGTKGR